MKRTNGFISCSHHSIFSLLHPKYWNTILVQDYACTIQFVICFMLFRPFLQFAELFIIHILFSRIYSFFEDEE